MEVEKRGVKGGLFQFFDWNGKSRKKLFSSKSEVPESSSRGKENYHGPGIARHEQGLERGFPPNSRGHNDYHYASSASGDSEYGTKAPGVVARLMGLDSLPTSNVNEPCFTPYIESHSCRDSSHMTAAPAFQSEHDIVIFESVRNKLDGLNRNPLDLRLQRVQSRPLERFQTEVLPPKSAKPISITHHRLLSPIKSPGFIPPKNAAYIIVAAAKMIEQSPRSTTKGNFQSVGSSIPLRVRDLKEKAEAAQRLFRSVDASEKSKEQNSKSMKKQLNARGKGRFEDSYRGPEESKTATSQRLRNTEKSGSLAIQAKANTQKRDALTSVGSRNCEKPKEHNDVKPRSVGGLPNTQKRMEKETSSRRPSEMLRLNNQKQNCASTADRDNFGPSCSQPKERKESNLSSDCIHGRMSRTVNKIVVNNVVTSRKTNFVAVDTGKDISQSRVKTTSKKKLPLNGNIQSGGSVPHKEVMRRDEKSLKCNIAFDGDSEWDRIDKKNNLDVISFTFTSPIKKSGSGSGSCNTISEATCLSFPNYDPCVHESNLRNSSESSSGIDFIAGDALSVLLEQKLKELTSMVEVSQRDESEADSFPSSASSYQSTEPTFSLVKSLPTEDNICNSKQEIQNTSNFPYTDKLMLKAENESKGLRCMKRDDDNVNIEFQRYVDLQGSLSVSSQPSLSGASTDSFSVGRCTEGQLPFLSPESYEGMGFHSTRKSHPAGGEVDISDTASSLSVGTISETVTSNLFFTDSKDSSNWELQYIGDILGSGELFLEDFALGQAHKITAPDLFQQLENQKMDSIRSMEDYISERKVLFDCVCEWLEVRCGRLLAGSYKIWANQMTMLRTRQCLADYLYREISSWKNVEEVMVDELVDKDMSSKNEKWIDFEIEAFEEGSEIEKGILTSLVDELIDDFMF